MKILPNLSKYMKQIGVVFLTVTILSPPLTTGVQGAGVQGFSHVFQVEDTTEPMSSDMQIESEQDVPDEPEVMPPIEDEPVATTDVDEETVDTEEEKEEDDEEIDVPKIMADEVVDNLVHRDVVSWAQLLGAIADRTVDVIHIRENFAAPNSTGWHHIGLTALPAGHGSTSGNGSGSARELVIEGHGHTLNFNDWAITFNNNNITGAGARRNGWLITWRDLDIFCTNIWGYTTYNDLTGQHEVNSTLVYENIRSFGSQLIHSPAGQVIMNGNVESHVLARHEPPFNPGQHRNLTGLQNEQANIQVQNLTIGENATVTLSVLHAGNIDLMSGGTLRLLPGATLNLHGSPTTARPGAASNMDEARGVNMQIRAGGNLILEPGSVLNVNPKPTFSALSMLGTGADVFIHSGATVNIDTLGRATATAQGDVNNMIHMGAGASLDINGNFNIISNNTTGGANLMRIGNPAAGGTATAGSRTNLNVRGRLNIEARGMGSSTASLIHFGNPAQISPNANGGNFIVHPGGELNLVSDSNAANHHLIYFNAGLTAANASIFEFRDARSINLQRLGSVPGGAGLIGMNGTVGNLRLDIQEIDLWNGGNFSETPDFNWHPLFAARINYSGPNATTAAGIAMSRMTMTQGGFGLTAADSDLFYRHFTTRDVQRITMGFIPDVNVAVHPEFVTDATTFISGTGTPGSYLRITDDPVGVLSPNETNHIPSPVENQSGLFTVPDLISNPQEYIDDFTLMIPDDGNWEYELPEGYFFTASGNLRAFAFKNGKSAANTVPILDVTPPTGDGVTVVLEIGDPMPQPSDFVENLFDSNPGNVGFRVEFSDINPPALIGEWMEVAGTYPVHIDVFDDAGNKAEIVSELVVIGYLEVTFHYNFDGAPNGGIYRVVNVRYGDVLDVQDLTPTQNGAHFLGWFLASIGGAAVDFTLPMTTDLDVYAHWASLVDFTFTKVDQRLYSHIEAARPIENAVFDLFVYDYSRDEWVRINQGISDASGDVLFENLIAGEVYRLVESSVPEQFMLPLGYWYIDIDMDGGITVIKNVPDEDTPHFTNGFLIFDDGWYLGNDSSLSLTFTKMDERVYSQFEDALPLAGAVFELSLFSQDDWHLLDSRISDDTGYVSFSGLTASNVYRLVESRAPNGYEVPRGYWLVHVDDQGGMSIEAIGDMIPAFRGATDGNLYLGNLETLVLPILGGLGLNESLLLIGGTLSFVSIGVFVFYRFRQRKYE